MHAHYMCYHTHTPIHTHVQAMLHANMSSQTNYTSAHIRRLPWRKPCNRAYDIKSNKTVAPFCKVIKSSTLNIKHTIFSHFYSYNLHVNRKQNTNSNYIPAHFYLGTGIIHHKALKPSLILSQEQQKPNLSLVQYTVKIQVE